MTDEERTAFIENIAGYVLKYAKDYGIMVHSPIIAQAILESGWGQSRLSAEYHNYFGLKCGSKWTGASVNMDTKEEYTVGTLTNIKANFRAYDSMEDGIKGYFEFIQLSRYANLKGITDPLKYLETIKADGYATSSTYVENNYKLIQQYELTKYDNTAERDDSMAVIVGSARSSFGNTAAGDQNGGKEVSTQNYYVHSKGWRAFRAKDAQKRFLIADAMKKACANNDIGYSQGTRLTLTENVKPYGYDPSRTTKKVNTDCSALVRCCCLYAGINVGNFITSGEASKLLGTGEFTELKGDKYTKQSDYLCAGDILVTKTKGHTVVVLTSGAKCEDTVEEVTYNLGDRTLENGDIGDDVKELQSQLIQLGYSCGDWGADGEFGDCTQLAVESFQRTTGLTVTGIADANTIEMIEKVSAAESSSVVKKVVIQGGNCYVRKGPNTSAEKLGVAYKGSSYPYAGETSTDGWLSITFKDQKGWVSGKYSAAK